MASSAKGTMENPYFMSECDELLDNGTWPGGYVKDDSGQVSYVTKSVTVWGYSGSGSGSEEHGSDFEFSTGSHEWHEPDDEENGSEEEGNRPPSGNEGENQTDGNYGGGAGGGGHSSSSNIVIEPNAGEGSEDEVQYFTYDEVESMMNNGTWKGGYIKGCGYIPEWEVESRPLTLANSGDIIYQRALHFEGVPYKSGGVDKNGIDCSGLVSVALGLETRWTTKSGDIPGLKKMDFTSIDELRKGDILVWRWQDLNGKWCGHAAIYVEGNSIFHAHGAKGSPTNMTNDLEKYWLKKYKAPVIYRK